MTTRSSRDDEVTNNIVRKKFEEWWEFNNRPHIKLIAKDMGIAYPSFISWRNHKREFSYETLRKIRSYFKKLEDRQNENLEIIKRNQI